MHVLPPQISPLLLPVDHKWSGCCWGGQMLVCLEAGLFPAPGCQPCGREAVGRLRGSPVPGVLNAPSMGAALQ